jgi:hypothetical protein
LPKKLKARCPCGYDFEIFDNEENAIMVVRAHFKQFHADLLPFGLSREEAFALLRIVSKEERKSDRKNIKYKNQAGIFASQAKSSFTHEKTKQKVQIIEL